MLHSDATSEQESEKFGHPCAGSQREVDEIVNDYLGGGKQVGGQAQQAANACV